MVALFATRLNLVAYRTMTPHGVLTAGKTALDPPIGGFLLFGRVSLTAAILSPAIQRARFTGRVIAP